MALYNDVEYDLDMKEQMVLSRRDKLSQTTGIIIPGAMTRSSQHNESKKRKKKNIQKPLFTCDGIHFFTSKKLVVLYETHKDNNFILSKLVRKAEHQLNERDRFTFKQVQNDYEEKHDHLAKLMREAHEAKHRLKCKCPQTIESRIRHAKSRIRREKLVHKHLLNPSFMQEQLLKEENKYNENAAKKNADMMINGSDGSTENDDDPIVRTRDDNFRKSFAHSLFNGITIGEIDRLRLEKLMFVLAYDDVTNHSMDMEMQRLLLEARLKEEELAKQEALKALGVDEIDEVLLLESSDDDNDEDDDSKQDDDVNPFADEDFHSESSSSEDDDNDDGEEDEVKKVKSKDEVTSEIDRDTLVIIPTVEISFELVLWIVHILIHKVQYSTLENFNRKMFCDLTGGSEGQLCCCVSMLIEFESTLSFEDSIEEHELACRFENALHNRVRRFEKERKMNGFVKGHYDPVLKCKSHEWLEHEWYFMDDTNQPTWSDASVIFIHASRIMPMGYENKRGKVIRKKLSIQKASKRIFKFFRLGPRWYSYVWRQRKHEKLNILKEQYQWLNQGTILILAHLSDYPEQQTRKYIQNDTFNWEGPLVDLTGGAKTAKKFESLERRELFIPVNNIDEENSRPPPAAEQLTFEFYRKKTTRGEGLWKNTKTNINDNSGNSFSDYFASKYDE
jgi:hypothetical protein